MNVAADAELLELLADRPELLAVADAVAATQRRRRSTPRRALLVAAAAAIVAVAALAAPWGERGPTTVERALAALGSGPVLHAVVEYSGDDAIVDLESGREQRRVHRTEYWYDSGRETLRVRESTDGIRVRELVATPEGGYSDTGSFETGNPREWLEPTLAAFATGYREVLASGDATLVGETTVDGRKAKLVAFRRSSGEVTTVTVDAETSRPLQFSSTYRGGRRSPLFTVAAIESMLREPGLFAPPELSPPRPTAGEMREGEPIELDRAASELEATPVWLGRSFGGRAVGVVELTRGVTELTDGRKVPAKVVRIAYGRVRLSQASTSGGAYMIGMEDGGDPPPPAGSIAITRGFGRSDAWEGEFRSHGLYVRVTAPSREQLLEAARSLRPVR